jgi:hypothetical protein
MDSAYAIGSHVRVSFGNNTGLYGKVTGFIVELREPVSDYSSNTGLETRTTHVHTINVPNNGAAVGKIVLPSELSKPALLNSARHIYFDEYIIGKEYQKIDSEGNYTDLGILLKKKSVGRPYDMDIKLTYQKDGVEKEHVAVYGPHYREKPTAS